MTGTGSLVVTEEAQQLRLAVRSLLSERAGWQDVLARTETDDFGASAWSGLAAEIGATGLPFGEDDGGARASWNEVALVAEEVGRAVGDVPYVTSAVLAAAILHAVGDTADLSEVAGGRIAAVALPWTAVWTDPRPAALVVDGKRVSGSIDLVAGAAHAELLVVPAEESLLAVDASSAQVEPVVSLDMSRPLAAVRFDGAEGRLLAAGDDARRAVERAFWIGNAMLASEQLGIAEASLEMLVDYVQVRHQFGRPIGSFQAVKHRLADLWTEIVTARAVARYAAVCVDQDPSDLPIAASMARVVCGRTARHATQELVQLHGGIGFTWEHPAHLYLKRAKADSLALGSLAWHRDAVGQRADI